MAKRIMDREQERAHDEESTADAGLISSNKGDIETTAREELIDESMATRKRNKIIPLVHRPSL